MLMFSFERQTIRVQVVAGNILILRPQSDLHDIGVGYFPAVIARYLRVNCRHGKQHSDAA